MYYRRIDSYGFWFLGVPGEPMPVTCEEDLFDYIDMPYKKPAERNA